MAGIGEMGKTGGRKKMKKISRRKNDEDEESEEEDDWGMGQQQRQASAQGTCTARSVKDPLIDQSFQDPRHEWRIRNIFQTRMAAHHPLQGL